MPPHFCASIRVPSSSLRRTTPPRTPSVSHSPPFSNTQTGAAQPRAAAGGSAAPHARTNPRRKMHQSRQKSPQRNIHPAPAPLLLADPEVRLVLHDVRQHRRAKVHLHGHGGGHRQRSLGRRCGCGGGGGGGREEGHKGRGEARRRREARAMCFRRGGSSILSFSFFSCSLFPCVRQCGIASRPALALALPPSSTTHSALRARRARKTQQNQPKSTRESQK